jgi:hypothetical protein
LGALDGYRQPTLMTSAGAGHAARENLAAFLDERSENLGFLVIDVIDAVYAETADLLLADVVALAALVRSAATACAASAAE